MLFGFIRVTGQIGIGSLLTLITAIIGFATVYMQTRRTHERINNVNEKVDEISTSVNGVAPGQQTMVQNVRELHDQMVSDNPK